MENYILSKKSNLEIFDKENKNLVAYSENFDMDNFKIGKMIKLFNGENKVFQYFQKNFIHPFKVENIQFNSEYINKRNNYNEIFLCNIVTPLLFEDKQIGELKTTLDKIVFDNEYNTENYVTIRVLQDIETKLFGTMNKKYYTE